MESLKQRMKTEEWRKKTKLVKPLQMILLFDTMTKTISHLDLLCMVALIL